MSNDGGRMDPFAAAVLELEDAVDEMASSADAREVRLALLSCRRAIIDWPVHPPAPVQVRAMQQRLREIERRVRRESPTLPPPPAAEARESRPEA